MWLLFVVLVVLCFGFVLLYGAPYLPTRRRQVDAALDLLDLKTGQTVYELGCGDGRVLRRAAERGIHGVGYELNPILVVIARVVTWRYRRMVTIHWSNFWNADVSRADGIFVFLLDRYMAKLDEKLQNSGLSGVSVVSFAFKIPGRKISKSKDGIFLYRY